MSKMRKGTHLGQVNGHTWELKQPELQQGCMLGLGLSRIRGPAGQLSSAWKLLLQGKICRCKTCRAHHSTRRGAGKTTATTGTSEGGSCWRRPDTHITHRIEATRHCLCLRPKTSHLPVPAPRPSAQDPRQALPLPHTGSQRRLMVFAQFTVKKTTKEVIIHFKCSSMYLLKIPVSKVLLMALSA